MTDEEIRDIAMSINILPGKCLGFKSPVDAFLNEPEKYDNPLQYKPGTSLMNPAPTQAQQESCHYAEVFEMEML